MEANDKKQIIVLMYPGCIELEVMLAAKLCNQVHQVRVATISGDGHRGSNGFSYNADYSVSEVDLNNCAGLLIPGGDPYDLIEGDHASKINQLLIGAAEMKIPIGAICAAPAVLGKHGLLKTKRFTHGYGDAHKEFLAPIWEGGIFTDSDLEVDGTLITAKPEAHIEFATRFALEVGAIKDQESLERLTRYYKNQKSMTCPAYIDHITIVASDLAKSKKFYTETFQPLGIKWAFGEDGIFHAYDIGTGLFEIRQAREGEIVGPSHIALRVANHEQVDLFHSSAITAGGTDNGAPGLRKEYTPNYYASFVLDPDGHNIEAMFDK